MKVKEMNYNEMKKRLLESSESYYNKSESIMSDKEFDELKDEFTRLYPNDDFITQIGSPVPDNSHWEKAKHEIQMTSLNKVNSVEQFQKWASNNPSNRFVITDKLDGISICLSYSNGTLQCATTRGDGIFGEVITRNVIKMKNVKKSLGNFSGCLRGEIVLKQNDFIALNEKLSKSGEKTMSNPRNAASGIAKRLDSTDSEYLTVLYYFITGDFQNESDKFKKIESLGLKTSFWKEVDCDGAIDVYNDFQSSKRSKWDVDIDGLVVTVEDIKFQKKLGMLNDNPKYSIAWKFEAMTAETTLIDIEWNVGNQQILTPVVIFQTVRLGADVSRASLCNVDMFIEMNLAKGDKILVSRRNDVIPKAESVIKKSGNKPFEYPKICPVCNEPTTIKGKFLYCLNDDCDSNIIGSLNKFIDKTGMLGISESTLTKLYEASLVKNPSDLYRISVDDVFSLEGFGKKSAQKVIDIINNHKEMSLAVFIGALNIPQFSESMTKLLVESGYDTLEKLMKISKSELISIKGIEEKKASAFLNGMYKKKELIKDLLKVGVKIIEKRGTNMKSSSSKLSGKSFCVTGALEMGKRDDFIVMLEENGGVYKSNITKDLNYLVTNDNDSGSDKNRKAEKMGVKVINEKEFLALCK